MVKWKELLIKFSSPIVRLEKYMLKNNLLKEGETKQYRDEAKESVKEALKHANEHRKPNIDEMFTDVYDTIPQHIADQKEELRAHLKKHHDKYDLNHFENGEKFPYQ